MMPKRIQRQRTKGWRMPPNAVSVTRPTLFGNPFETAAAFRQWLERGEIAVSQLLDQTLFPWSEQSKQRLAVRRQRILEAMHTLAGKDLACFCEPGAECHADVLISMVEKLSRKK